MVKEPGPIKSRRKILKYRGVVLTVFALLLLFLVGIMIYKHFNPFALPRGIERRTLFVLIPLGLLTLALWFPYSWAAAKLKNPWVRWVPSTLQSVLRRMVIRLGFLSVFFCIFFYIKQVGEKHRQKLEQCFKYGFLFFLFLIALGSLQFEILEKIPFFNSFSELIKDYQYPLVLLTIGFGFFAFYLSRKKFEKDLETEKGNDQFAEQKRQEEFNIKFPKINKIPILRNFIRYYYKEGWGYLLGLMLVVVLGFFLRFYKVGSEFLNGDEAISGLAALGFLEHGVPIMPSGVIYDRELLTTILLSTGVYLFGFNELGLRIIGVLLGSVIIIFSYLIGKIILSKKAGLLFSLLMAISVIEIAYSGWARMYIFFQFFFIINIYFSLLFLTKKQFIYWLISILAVMLAFASHRMGAVLLIIPVTTLLFHKLSGLKNYLSNPKYLILTIFPAILVLYFVKDYLIEIFVRYIYGGVSEYNFSALFDNLFNSYTLIVNELGTITIIFCSLAAVFLYCSLKKKNKNILIILFINVIIFPLLIDLVIYSQGFEVRIRYIFFVMPFFIFLIAATIIAIGKMAKSRYAISIAVLVLLIITGSFTVYPSHFSVDAVEKENFIADVNEIIEKQNSLLIGYTPTLLTFYFKEPEYWLVSSSDRIRESSKDGKYTYTNTEVLDSLEKLKELEEGDNIIIIVEKDRWRLIHGSIQKYITNNYIKYDAYNQDIFDVFIKSKK